MFKKVVLGVVLVGAGLWLVTSSRIGSYVRTGWSEVTGYVDGQVPIDFEIKRAKQLLAELTPEVEKARRAIAVEKVQVARLEKEAGNIANNLKGEQVVIVALRDKLGMGLASYKVGDHEYTKEYLQKDLQRRFDAYKKVDAQLKTRQEILAHRQASLEAAQQKYEGLQDSRDQLARELAALEAQYNMVQVKQTTNRLQIDDSKLSQVKQLLTELGDKVQVEHDLAEADGVLIKPEDVRPDTKAADLGHDIDNYFGKQPATIQGTAL